MAETVAAIGTILSCFCRQNCLNSSIFVRIKHMVNAKEEIKKLIKITTELIALKGDVNERLHRAKIDQGEVPTHVVQKWLNDVQRVLDDTHLIEEKVKTSKRCLNGFLPTCCSNLSLGQRISELIMEGTKLTRTGHDLLKDTLTSHVAKIGVELPEQKVIGKTTAQTSLVKIWEFLMDDESGVIGVYGMGGIGKTKMAMDINNRLVVKPGRFNKVIWVTVSKGGDIHGIQVDIAKKFNLDLSNEQGEVERIGKLHEVLKWRQNILFILDDMWQAFSLDEIGIPELTTDNGCKLLLTTRSKEVCKRMGCREAIVKVETLTKQEAWELFLNKVDVVLTPEVMSIAEIVADECSGLPLAIITVGAAMRGNGDIGDWTVALNDLRDFSNRIIDSEDIVFERLKFSYDRLPNEKLRKCFLCCALYPEDYQILTRDLVDFWIMDGMVKGRNRQDKLLEGQFILKKLKEHCLLESVEAYDDEYNEMSDGVKMHDLIRDMALRITNKCFMVKAGARLSELPNDVEWEEVLERASFIDSEIIEVSVSPSCPKLSTLFLGNNSFLNSVIYDFFVHMQCLRVLDLRCGWDRRNFQLESLPDSISYLVNLRALRLSWCTKLEKVPSLSKLVLLRTLELNNTAIKKLPEGIEMLVNLRCLNLHAVELRETIPMGLISKLSALQELYLGGISMDKLYELGSGEFFVQELLSLKELENLNVTFHCLSDYGSYVGSSKFNGLKCFFLAIGEVSYARHSHLGLPPRATVHLGYSPDEHTAQNAPFFPQNTKRVEIILFNDLARLNELRWLIKEVGELLAFRISWCNKIECIWWWSSEDETEELSVTCWLQRLETIDIWACPKLYTLFNGIPTLSSVPPFFCLKVLRIWDCHNLKNVFSSSRLLQLLQNLEEIKVSDCNELEELIGEESSETPITLPRLKELGFVTLRKLKSIGRGLMICDSLEGVGICNCSKLKRLPQFKGKEQSTPPASLKAIEGSREWWDSLEWDPAYPRNILQPFFKEWDRTYGSEAGNVRTGAVCDNCEMDLIVGKRYKCKECYNTEGLVGFDLCEECYNSPSKHSDLVNQHHTQGHTFELYYRW